MIESAEIQVSAIEVRLDNLCGWHRLPGGNLNLDLLNLDEAVSSYLSSVDLPAGQIKEIRLILISGSVTTKDGKKFDLNIESGKSRIKIKVSSDIVSGGGTTTVKLEFDTICNFRAYAKLDSLKRYRFKATIRALKK